MKTYLPYCILFNLACINVQAQSFELRLTSTGDEVIHVEMRESSGNPPKNTDVLTDLVFGICWDKNYQVDLLDPVSDYTIERAGSEKIVGDLEVLKFAKSANPMTFPASWSSGDWMTIMRIPNSMNSQVVTGTFSICPANIQELNINYNLVDYAVAPVGDADSVKISGSVSYKEPGDHAGFTWTTTPNPSKGTFDLVMQSPVQDEIQLVVSDVAGKALFTDVVGVKAGENRHTVRLNKVQGGVYQVQLVWSDASTQSQNILVVE